MSKQQHDYDTELNNLGESISAIVSKQIYKRPVHDYKAFEDRLYSDDGISALNYLTQERKLKVATLKHFNIGCNYNNHITIPIFKDGELVDFKFRDITEKNFYRTEQSETWAINDVAFSQALETESKYICIVESEIDCMSLFQLGFHSTISGTGGAMGPRPWISRITEGVKRIYIVTDNDEVGDEYGKQLAEALGYYRCKRVRFPEGIKDANEFLQSGGTAEQFIGLLKESKRYELENIALLKDAYLKVVHKTLPREPLFMQALNDHTYGGVPERALVVISGITGIGKSNLLMNVMVGHANNGKKTLLMSFENDPMTTVDRLISIKYRKRRSEMSDLGIEKMWQDLETYPLYLDISNQYYKIHEVRRMLEDAKKMYGIKIVGFDHLEYVDGILRAESEMKFSETVYQFKKMAKELDIIIYLVCHIRKVNINQDKINNQDLKYSSSIAQNADMIWFFVRKNDGQYSLKFDKIRDSMSFIDFPVIYQADTGNIEYDIGRTIQTLGAPVPYEYRADPNNQTKNPDIPDREDDPYSWQKSGQGVDGTVSVPQGRQTELGDL